MTSSTGPKPKLTREQLRVKLNELGYPLTKSYFDKLCLPSVNAGPPVAMWWGKRPLYELDGGIAWAESRCSSSPSGLVSSTAEQSPTAA
jgi:hypothetical protein